MVSRSATSPPAKPAKYKRGLSSRRREKLPGINPAHAVLVRALEQSLKELPRRRIVHRVMREPSRRLRPIGAAVAPRSEVLHRCPQRNRLAHEAARAAPIDDVDMGIGLVDAGRGVGRIARAVATQP